MTNKTGKARSNRQWRVAYLSAAAGLLGLILPGCSGTNQGHLAGDPLFGEFGLKQPGPSSPPPPPPIPSAQFSSSPAALAAGPLPGARPLAIDGSGQGANPIIPASANGATLRPIVLPVPRESTANGPTVIPAAGTAAVPAAVPVPGTPAAPVPGTAAVTVPPSGAPQPQAVSDAVLLDQLKARGVLYHKIDTLPEGIRLSVIVPNPPPSDATRVLEATGRDFNSAAQAILQKLGG
jgi:hypothetical protein